MNDERWIPVEEKLPEELTPVYATCQAPGRENWVIESFYTTFNKGTPWGNIPILVFGEAKVIAWMPREFPEPYVDEGELTKA